MRIDILTIFPKYFDCALDEGLLRIAWDKGLLTVDVVDIREYAHDKHRSVDDYPYGGGAGMIMKPEPIVEALEDLLGERASWKQRARIVLLTPRGKRLDQRMARDLSGQERIVLVSGHYEGVDERVHVLADDELSVGDYVLSGGEPAALVVIDAMVRLIPGVLGSEESLADESFEQSLLEYPQYTRPPEHLGMSVPDVLLSGDHARITKWRRREAIRKTWLARPDLLAKTDLSPEERAFLGELEAGGNGGEHSDE